MQLLPVTVLTELVPDSTMRKQSFFEVVKKEKMFIKRLQMLNRLLRSRKSF